MVPKRARSSSTGIAPTAGASYASSEMSVLSRLRGSVGRSGFGYSTTAEEVVGSLDLRGQSWLITGVTSGLGRESARALRWRGARVIGTGREQGAAQSVLDDLDPPALEGSPHPVGLACELTDPASIRECVGRAQQLATPLDGILCNAGVMALPERTLVHGQEAQFFTNHVAHFLLVQGLMSKLSPTARVVVVSSAAHRAKRGIEFEDLTLSRNYRPWKAYGHSKLANLLFARSLAQRFEGTGRTANAVHPGVIATNLTRHMPALVQGAMPALSGLALKTIAEGAATQVWAAVHPGAAEVNGEYLVDCNVAFSHPNGRDMAMAERLWKVTEAIVAAL